MWTGTIALFVLIMSASAFAQVPAPFESNQCVVCHLHLVQTRSVLTHTDEWITSRHALYRIGCEKCHGGDAKAATRDEAHRGVMPSRDRGSSVYWMELPKTCGGCHQVEASAFALSFHGSLLQQGSATAPTCTTCHTSMTADVPSGIELQERCSRCHSNDHDDRAVRGRRACEDIAALRKRLSVAKVEVAGVLDSGRRQMLDTAWRDANVAVRSCIAAIHRFDQSRVDERLADAKAQVDRLVRALPAR